MTALKTDLVGEESSEVQSVGINALPRQPATKVRAAVQRGFVVNISRTVVRPG